MRDREHVLNVMEETTGGRLIQNYYRIGGLQADIDPNFVKNVKDLIAYLRPMVQEYMDVFGDNVITRKRFCNVGVMDAEGQYLQHSRHLQREDSSSQRTYR